MESVTYTIGHSNHSWETFASLLELHKIEVLVDVRSNPVSRFARFANRRRLPELLRTLGIDHFWMGDTLGGKPSEGWFYDDVGGLDYRSMAAEPSFAMGIERLLEVGRGSRTAIMCAEEDPASCHRTLLLGPALEARGAALAHIRKSGAIWRTPQDPDEEGRGPRPCLEQAAQNPL